ncbi:MAG TPA: hypothetical protein VNB49_09015 [Candidatus Dormibacteraeota bacterium]|nr:hypothetical protein [Candidatus Dormibacteraeota bacterium]
MQVSSSKVWEKVGAATLAAGIPGVGGDWSATLRLNLIRLSRTWVKTDAIIDG